MALRSPNQLHTEHFYFFKSHLVFQTSICVFQFLSSVNCSKVFGNVCVCVFFFEDEMAFFIGEMNVYAFYKANMWVVFRRISTNYSRYQAGLRRTTWTRPI